MKPQAEYFGVHEVTYGDRTTDYSKPHLKHPALLKDKKHSNQLEVRAIWKPRNTPIEPIRIPVKKAVSFCREVNV